MKPQSLLALLLPAALALHSCNTCRSAGPEVRVGEASYFVNTDRNGVALQGGHDPVAFFTEGKPVKGSKSLQARHEGATYWFASQANLEEFQRDPGHYAPAYGGYCGYAASIDRVSPIEVDYFQIIDGRLILQHNEKALSLWNQEQGENIQRADANWPGLFERNARGERVLVNVDSDGLALEGHDAVAYFTEHRPVPGLAEFEAHYNGAVYRFVSKENRVTFESDPEQYAPAFGGFCGYAASINTVSPVNIHIFQISDGRLVLQHTPRAYELFNADRAGAMQRATQNWPGLVACEGH